MSDSAHEHTIDTSRLGVIALGSDEALTTLSRSATAPMREVVRAKVLLRYADRMSISQIQREVGVSRPTLYKCIDKALAAGVEAGLKDRYHSPRAPEILGDAKAWVVSVVGQSPRALGYAAQLWTVSSLTVHLRQAAEQAGFPRLASISRSSVWRILEEHRLKPHRVRDYLARRDPEFERKMHEVLMVCREVFMTPETSPTPEAPQTSDAPVIYTVSVDEKPGVQALGTTAPDRPPVAGKHPAGSRDPETVRHGTLSILAALDLHSGELIARVEPRHRSREFIALLERLHRHYPPNAVIRVVLDNHSAHISRETMAYLKTRPGRFVYVHTPKHGSWLNLIEGAFSKMARTFLRHIRVDSLDGLKSRILQGIDEMNAAPVPLRWRKFDLDLA